MSSKRSIVLALAASTAIACLPGVARAEGAARPDTAQAMRSDDLGDIDFPTSGSAAAHAHFVRGVKLLHSFEFPEARAAFARAQRLEPDFAMAYWGEAMSHYAPVWSSMDAEAMREALEKLAPSAEARRALAPSDRERDWLDSAEILLADGGLAERSAELARALARLAERWSDPEARVFRALAILGSAGGRDPDIYRHAADVAEGAFTRNPRHPGAAHYLIHATDDPWNARRGLAAARAYGSIAPASPHAQHMPAHIFLPLGMWREAAASNRASIDSAPAGSRHAFHAYPWLLQAYTQLGRYRDARAVLDEVAASDAWRAERAWNRMRDLYVVETGTCPDDLIGDDAPRGTLAGGRFARALCDLAAGDLDAARAEVEAIGDGRFGDAAVLRRVLESRIALAEGDAGRAIRAARRAVEAEEEAAPTRDEYGPGTPLEPPGETLGRALLAGNRPDRARAAFVHALELRPNRAQALRGLIAAAAASGDQVLAHATVARLRKMWSDADPELRAQVDALIPRP